jgi:acyl-CoA thioester hydrolase
MDVAWHGHYLAWFELGRTELMRELGCSYAELEDVSGIFFPVRRAGARYLRPSHYDERLTVVTRIAEVGGAHVRFEYVVVGDDDGRERATGFTEHAAVGRDGRPRRMPAELRQRLGGTEPA